MDPAIARPHVAVGPRQRWGRVAGLAAAAGAAAYVRFADPASAGVYPPCPSRVVLGLDCPACGGLRGSHDLLRGDVVAALDHNLLLPLWLALLGVAIGAWVVPLVGRPAPVLHPPRWLVVAGVVVAAAFTVLRNLPVAGLEVLASGA